MSSLRERKKQQARNNIIESAKASFLSEGYANTTIAGIAEKANVGVGTIYNYFRSKGELLIAIFAEEMPSIISQSNGIVEHSAESVTDSIVQMIQLSTEMFTAFPKDFMREIFSVVLGNIDESKQLRSGMFQLDMQMMEQIGILLAAFQKSGKLKASVNIEEAVQSIYAVIMMQFTLYVYTDSMNFEQVIQQIKNQMEFIFAEKVN